MSDRISRKEIKHDKFVDEMESAYVVARRNKPIVFGSIAAVLILIVALVGWSFWASRQEAKAQQRLAEAIEIMEAPLAQPDEGAPAEGSYRTEEEKVAKAEPIFREITEQYSGRNAAEVASLYLARLEVERGELAPAAEKYQAFIKQHPDHLLAQAASVSLYDVRIALGQSGEVITDLEKDVAAADEGLPNDVALTLLARAYEAAGDQQKSRDAWQRVVNEYPDSPYTLEAQRKLFRG